VCGPVPTQVQEFVILRSMLRFRLVAAFACASAPAALLTTPLAAQEAPTPEEAQAIYADTYDAINEGVDNEAGLDSTMKVVRREFASVPAIAAADAMSPGLIDEIMTELRPVFGDYQERVRVLYRPRMIAVIAGGLTPSEAGDVADFYRSELGRRILDSASRNYSPDATLDGISELEEEDDFEATRQDVETDLRNASAAAMKELRDEDFATFARLAIEKPALLKLNTISPQIVSLRAEMENEQPNAQEEARIQTVVESVFARRLGD